MVLPQNVIDKDQRLDYKLSQTADELMELRWHWTLDESNTGRVSFAAYARDVGRDASTIRQDAHGWEDWLANEQGVNPLAKMPGQPNTPGDYRERAKMSEEKRRATEAIAKASGKSYTSVAQRGRKEIDAVVSTARERAERKGTTVEHEIDLAAERREQGRQASKKLADERKKKMTAAYIAIEGDIGVMLQRGRSILRRAEGIDFGVDETELLVDALSKLRALLNLLDMRFTGHADVDWDTELAKITE